MSEKKTLYLLMLTERRGMRKGSYGKVFLGVLKYLQVYCRCRQAAPKVYKCKEVMEQKGVQVGQVGQQQQQQQVDHEGSGGKETRWCMMHLHIYICISKCQFQPLYIISFFLPYAPCYAFCRYQRHQLMCGEVVSTGGTYGGWRDHSGKVKLNAIRYGQLDGQVSQVCVSLSPFFKYLIN